MNPLPRHLGYFRTVFRAKYGTEPTRLRVIRTKEYDYAIFLVPSDLELDPEDQDLVIAETEAGLELAIRDYNTRRLPDERFVDGTLVPAKRRPKGRKLNTGSIQYFKEVYTELYEEEAELLLVWRDFASGKTYALFADPPAHDTGIEPVEISGQKGILVRYRQMDIVPDSLFDEDGVKVNRHSARERGVPYIRVDTDDYRPDKTPDQIIETKMKDRDQKRRKKKEIPEPTVAEPMQHDIDAMRERELEMRDPISEEELEELEQVRQRLYGSKS